MNPVECLAEAATPIQASIGFHPNRLGSYVELKIQTGRKGDFQPIYTIDVNGDAYVRIIPAYMFKGGWSVPVASFKLSLPTGAQNIKVMESIENGPKSISQVKVPKANIENTLPLDEININGAKLRYSAGIFKNDLRQLLKHDQEGKSGVALLKTKRMERSDLLSLWLLCASSKRQGALKRVEIHVRPDGENQSKGKLIMEQSFDGNEYVTLQEMSLDVNDMRYFIDSTESHGRENYLFDLLCTTSDRSSIKSTSITTLEKRSPLTRESER